MAHVDAGKTTLSERLLFDAGASGTLGDVDDGTTVMDWRVDEQERGITVTAASAGFSWRGLHINLVDTPGHVDFSVEVGRVLRVMDAAVVVVSGVEGVESQTEAVWREADHHELPRLVFVNKLDRDGADFYGPVEELAKRLEVAAVPFLLPLTGREGLDGVIDLFGRRWLRNGERRALVEEAVPDSVSAEVERLREALVEALCDADEEAMDVFIEHGELTPQQFSASARRATLARRIVPVFGGSALGNEGVQPLLDAIVGLLPSPSDRPAVRARDPMTGANVTVPCALDEPTCGICFKRSFLGTGHQAVDFVRIYSGVLRVGDELVNGRTGQRETVAGLVRIFSNELEHIQQAGAGDIIGLVGGPGLGTGDAFSVGRQLQLAGVRVPHPVLQAALEVETIEEEQRLIEALAELASEDPTVELGRDEDTGRVQVTAMGELHLEILRSRLERDYGVAVRLGRPQATRAITVLEEHHRQLVFDKQLDVGPVHQEVDVVLRPRTRGGEPVVVLSPAIGLEDGERARLEETVRAAVRAGAGGEPLVDAEVVLERIEPLPGTVMKVLPILLKQLLQDLTAEGAISVLEPEMKVVIWTPKDYVGRVLGDVSRRGGVVQGTDFRVGGQELTATVPLSRMFGFATHLRSLSQGRATFHMHFLGYRPVSV